MTLPIKAGKDYQSKKIAALQGLKGGIDTANVLSAKGGLGRRKNSEASSLSVDVGDPSSGLDPSDGLLSRYSQYQDLTADVINKKNTLVASNQSLKEQIVDLSPNAEASERDEVTGNTVYNFIAGQEKFKSNAYPDGSKRYSIGYGTISAKGKTITEEQAWDLMVVQADIFKKNVLEFDKKHNTGLNDNQIDALTSFAYTTGKGGLKKLFDNGNRNKEEIGEALKLYNQQEGKVLGGLNTRREAEYKLFTEGYSQ